MIIICAKIIYRQSPKENNYDTESRVWWSVGLPTSLFKYLEKKIAMDNLMFTPIVTISGITISAVTAIVHVTRGY